MALPFLILKPLTGFDFQFTKFKSLECSHAFINWHNLLRLFHESARIYNLKNNRDQFFEVWSSLEIFLKAVQSHTFKNISVLLSKLTALA
jgi:hypothetical protein